MNRRPPALRIETPSASPEEAAAVVAALERFMRETAPAAAPPSRAEQSGWSRAARLEAIGRDPGDAPGWGGAAGA